jgi:hypothetical protein
MCLNETYSKVRIGKLLSDSFPIQNSLKQGDAISPLLFNFALEYAIRKFQENQVGLKLNRTHKLLAYANDVILLGDNVDTIKKSTETSIEASKEVSLEVNVDKTKCMLLSRYQNASQNWDMNYQTGHLKKVQVFGNDSNKFMFVRFEVFTAVTMKNCSGMLRRVTLVRTDVSEELSASFIRVTRIGELGITLAVTSNRRTLQRNTDSGD